MVSIPIAVVVWSLRVLLRLGASRGILRHSILCLLPRLVLDLPGLAGLLDFGGRTDGGAGSGARQATASNAYGVCERKKQGFYALGLHMRSLDQVAQPVPEHGQRWPAQQHDAGEVAVRDAAADTECQSEFDPLESKLTVRAQANELQHVVAALTVDHHQVRLDVAIAKVLPFAAKRVIDILRR